MKPLFENWQNYLDKLTALDKKLNDQVYITKVLGIQIPLNESYPYSIELKEEILAEHMLYEGLLDSIKKRFKGATGHIKDLLTTLYKALTDPGMLNKLVGSIGFSGKHSPARPIAILLKRYGGAGEKLFNMLEKVIGTYDNMKTGWKKLMVGMGLTTLFAYIKEKFNFAAGMKDELKDEFMNAIKKYFGGNLLNNIISKATNINTYLGFLGTLAGGVSFVAKAMAGSIANLKFSQGFADLSAQSAASQGSDQS